ncbi:MAG: sigma-70 family RNA polymerase sigma factor [Planctomycetes bacterium]|nr:sigma-70 family RNA polymerase sigma factor [Planctomycetota bacterium]
MLQEVLLRCWQVAPRCRPDGRPNGLLRLGLLAARNLAISELRRLRTAAAAIAELERASDRDVGQWRPADPLLRERIADCRRKLPRQPQAALAARLGDAGAGEDRALAARLGMKLNTFLQNVTRARRLLADCLRRAGVDLGLEMP